MSDKKPNRLCGRCNDMFDWSKYTSTFVRMRELTIRRLERSILSGEGHHGGKKMELKQIRDLTRKLNEELLRCKTQQTQIEGLGVADIHLWSGHAWGNENNGEYRLELGTQRREWTVEGHCRLCKLLWSIAEQETHSECRELEVDMFVILDWISLLPKQLECEVEIHGEVSFRVVTMRSRIEGSAGTRLQEPVFLLIQHRHTVGQYMPSPKFGLARDLGNVVKSPG